MRWARRSPIENGGAGCQHAAGRCPAENHRKQVKSEDRGQEGRARDAKEGDDGKADVSWGVAPDRAEDPRRDAEHNCNRKTGGHQQDGGPNALEHEGQNPHAIALD